MIYAFALLLGFIFQEKTDARVVAEASVARIQQYLPAYLDDDLLAPQEAKEIQRVMHDLDVLNDAVDDDDYVRHVKVLERDWHELLGLDEYLEKVYLT